METSFNQISIGGCLIEPDEYIYVGDEIRLEIQLPNKNWLPLYCKVLYMMEDVGVGAKFINITKFEQELVAQIISHSLEKSGLPLQINPFENPAEIQRCGRAAPFRPETRKRRIDRKNYVHRKLIKELILPFAGFP